MLYAIGDIHGQFDLLARAHQLIEADAAEHGGEPCVVHVGDLVDRGSDSRGVIQFLINGIGAGRNWIVIKGNHDQMFCDFLAGGDGTSPRLREGVTWQSTSMGGAMTLKSYGVTKRLFEKQARFRARARRAVPGAHREFLESRPLSHREDGIIFVHAGIRPGFPLDAQDEEDLLWIRNEFLQNFTPHEALIVHGHTPVDEPIHYGNRINIDTGAGWGSILVPVVLDGGRWFALSEEGRDEIRPPDRYYRRTRGA